MADGTAKQIEQQIATWSGVEPPNEVARTMVAQFEALIASFEALRGQVAFEDEPSSFEAALAATKDKE